MTCIVFRLITIILAAVFWINSSGLMELAGRPAKCNEGSLMLGSMCSLLFQEEVRQAKFNHCNKSNIGKADS